MNRKFSATIPANSFIRANCEDSPFEGSRGSSFDFLFTQRDYLLS